MKVLDHCAIQHRRQNDFECAFASLLVSIAEVLFLACIYSKL